MNRGKKLLFYFLVMVVVLGLFCSCKKSENLIQVGSKDFTESFLLAELYSLALEDKGFMVDRKFNLGGTPVAQAALEKKEIDVYPEYTGTAMLQVLKLPIDTAFDDVYQIVKSEYKSKYDLIWLDYTQASNSQGLVITRSASEKYGIQTISDLQKKCANIRFASNAVFSQIADGMPLLEENYGEFNFKETKIFDNALKYRILEKGEMDLTIAFLTDGQLVDDDLVVLEDDKKVWPPYNIAPVVRNEVLAEFPEIETILNRVSHKLDNQTMQWLNSLVDIEQKDYETVAKEFYDNNIK